MRSQKIHFYGQIWKIIPQLSLLPLLIWSTGSLTEINSRLILCFYSSKISRFYNKLSCKKVRGAVVTLMSALALALVWA